jgi:tyrosyl-tRNA synthetase
VRSPTIDEQFARLTKGCVDIVRAEELRAKLERSKASGHPLTVKVGFDPTAPDLHLGHTVLLCKMRHFQDLGHRVVFVIGDFTGLIGDPTGRSKTRPPLTREQVDANAETYKAQVFKILDRDRTVVEFNSRWLSALGAEGMVRLAQHYTVAQMLERRDFKQRYEAGESIALHEFLYSLAQAFDSVHLKADVELGGTDQLFNLNVGRDLMPTFGLEPQVVLTTPLLEGLRGGDKMSKSLNNYVAVTEPPDEMFGKLMSISDELMWRYYLLLTDVSEAEIDEMRRQTAAGRLHPKTAKMNLAGRIVSDFHSATDAAQAAARFEARGRGETTGEEPMLEWSLPAEPRAMRQLLIELKLVGSGREADQKLDQGAVSIDGRKVGGKLDLQQAYLSRNREYRLDIGRRTYRLRVT